MVQSRSLSVSGLRGTVISRVVVTESQHVQETDSSDCEAVGVVQTFRVLSEDPARPLSVCPVGHGSRV